MPKFTKTLIDELRRTPPDRERVISDSETKGFVARLHPSGRVTYVFQFRLHGGRNGRRRKYTIGTHGGLTVEKAREIANNLYAEVKKSEDPVERRNKLREAPTVDALADRYIKDYAKPFKKPRSVEEDERNFRLHVRPALGRMQIGDVTRDDIERLHRSLRRDRPVGANRVLALLSAMFSQAEQWKLRPVLSNILPRD